MQRAAALVHAAQSTLRNRQFNTGGVNALGITALRERQRARIFRVEGQCRKCIRQPLRTRAATVTANSVYLVRRHMTRAARKVNKARLSSTRLFVQCV